ncbi:MAG: glycosyltransferase family 4 protein [Methylobacteriaceae bacterium]|nr:glycosyltransferase family 4 protein [Methylobacteriaceae bacterium]
MSFAKEPLTIVLCLDHAFVSGGQAKVAFDSAIGLKQEGHRPIVFAAAGPVDERLTAAGVEVVCLGQSDLLGNPSRVAAAVQGTWNKPAAEALARLLSGLPPERTIVHVHGWAKALSPSIAVPIARSGLPAVYTIHEYFLFCPNGGFYNYQRGHTCPLEPLSAACWATHCDSQNYPRKLWRNARLTLARDVAHLPEAFSDYIAISKFQLDVVGRRLAPGTRTHLISNPIDVPDLGPKASPAEGDVIFVGRISAEKGPFLFAEAARRASIIPTYIGDGPAAADLRARYPEARLLGWQSGLLVREAIRAARALVFPSLWYEGQPLTVLEAKGLGTPVIVADGCAGREEIEDGVSGLWFKAGDADSLATAISAVRDDALVSRLSPAAYADFWSDPPTLRRHVERITAVYSSMLGGNSAHRRVTALQQAAE